jgi:outer membrane lipoprotein-sorting protein
MIERLRRDSFRRAFPALLAALVTCGCAASRKRVVPPEAVRPALTASKADLIARYDRQARAIHSLNAAVDLEATAGSSYAGVIETYRRIGGFVLAEQPAFIRVIGQAPVVGKDIFDMVSDGATFRIYIPSKNKFLVGSAKLERPAKKPIENLRPQHLLDAFFWPPIALGQTVLFEESDEPPKRSYVLTAVEATPRGPEIARRIWFDRADLSVARIEIFGPEGMLLSDIRYSDWQPAGNLAFPRRILLRRPHDDYQLEIDVKRIQLNLQLPRARFELLQPPGTELVHVGEPAAEARP